ncbi:MULTISPECIES: FtsX-like permease family protein [unclassified Imperialibacter]|uniref:FtsX-like permease family protein n=1 Tax=unclassified Imperialibacter TaxID=2629706 RepID=UPI001256318C|nr:MULTISPECIES: FtsX-like permease family protein [unclassified Imperialibacter]CAD5279171.1 ABC transporter permease [Imperialibacter sp. 89]CAD5293227.1 ABC transporter permease [Imperialibacter sp. 75]VVS98998.1 putative ABC transport system permease protein [Imperialibacter sp. EC-SDR9]
MPKPTSHAPPQWALRFFRWFCHPDLLPGVEGDLMELYHERLADSGQAKANRRFIVDVLQLLRPAMIRPVEGHYSLNKYGMFRNYLKVGVRNILKYKAFSFINIFGLAAAMSVGMLILLMLADQRSYDQFSPDKERTFRILSKIPRSSNPNASSPFPLAAALTSESPIVETATQLVPGVGGDFVMGERSIELTGYFADESFFEVLGFGLLAGDKSAALGAPNSMIITSEAATRLFGEGESSIDLIGRSARFFDRGLRVIQLDFGSETGTTPVDWGQFTITGILDSEKYKSHLKFDALISSASMALLQQEQKVQNHTDDWDRYSYSYTYAKVKAGKTQADLTSDLAQLATQKYAGKDDLKDIRLIPQRLTEITPGIFVGNPSSLQLPIEAYYILGFLALVIMFTACLNYTNLSIARSLTRAKEIGVRKVNGAKRLNLVIQFLTESVLISLLALAMGFALLVAIKPAFERLWANQLLHLDLNGNLVIYTLFLGLAIVVGIVAGFYPAVRLSGYSPLKSLKKLNNEGPGKLGFRKVLLSFQFIISLFFIVTSIVIARQFKHFVEFEYGFDSQNIVNIPLQGNDYQLLANELGSVAGVSGISACEFIPAMAMTNGIGVKNANRDDEMTGFEYLRVDSGFVRNLGLSILAGRNLPAAGNAGRLVLVNEAGAKALGYETSSDIVGHLVEVVGYATPREVIGVMKDFRFQTPVMQDKVGPLLFINEPSHFSYLNVKIASNDLPATLEQLEAKWKAVDAVHPFKYQFYDNQLVNVNQWMGDLVAIIGFISFLAIIISCLGLLGMTTFTTERRAKEVGIRKVLGADAKSIALLLSRQFLVLLVVSVIIAAPLSYFINNLWLENFPNRVTLGFGTLFLGSLILLSLGLLTIISQTLRASWRNPVEALRAE